MASTGVFHGPDLAGRDAAQPAPRAAGSRNCQLGPLAKSALVWLGAVVFLALVNLFITFVGAGLERDPRAQLFAWPVILGFGLAGIAGVWLSHRTGFPSAWDTRVSNRQRFLYPIAIGLLIGVLMAGLDTLTHGARIFAEIYGLERFNAPFPGSPLFYTGGAILVEVIYRLVPIPLLLWLISSLALRGRAQTQLFWVLAILTSLFEPVTQLLDAFDRGLVGLALAQGAPGFALNLSQAVLFRRYGFLAAIVARVAMYLVWHIAYGNFICAC
jgi:hypothetical protein